MYEWGVVGRGEKEVEKQKARGNREDTEEVQISVVEDLKNVSLPDTPKRVFQKRICVLIMSLVQTVEQRDAGGEVKIGRPYYSRAREQLLFSLFPSFVLSVSLFLWSAPSSSSSLVTDTILLSSPFFYFSFEALFNLCRGIFPVHGDYYSQEMEEENRNGELLMQEGVVVMYPTTRGWDTFRGNRLEMPR